MHRCFQARNEYFQATGNSIFILQKVPVGFALDIVSFSSGAVYTFVFGRIQFIRWLFKELYLFIIIRFFLLSMGGDQGKMKLTDIGP
jgi:hypothetical protein